MDSQISKQIVFLYLSGRATPIEIQRVDDWIKNPDNFEKFSAYLLEWEKAHLQFNPDCEKAIANFWSKVESQGRTPTPELPIHPIEHRHPGLVAPKKLFFAAVCLLLAFSGPWLLSDLIRFKTLATDYGQIREYELPDGSRVTLNANSSLKLPRFGFGKGVREVWLTGEAEFSVIHTKTDQRFLVKAQNDWNVEVLGTEFTVFTRPRGNKIVLNRGKVRVDFLTEGKAERVIMAPGDLLKQDTVGNVEIRKIAPSENHSAWKEGLFIFDATSVSEICLLLEENFGVKVRPSNEEIAHKTISGNFETQSGEDLLEILREVLGLETSKHQNLIILH